MTKALIYMQYTIDFTQLLSIIPIEKKKDKKALLFFLNMSDNIAKNVLHCTHIGQISNPVLPKLQL